ncbi:hypothetical protein H7J86_32250 [Mycobacterium hackensackense]|nr:hypothetical protein [Mycobacterium hackensackense]
MRRLVVFACGVAMVVVALKQPWLNASTMADGGLQMTGAGAWLVRGADAHATGWPLQWSAVAGGILVVIGSLTSRIFSYGLRVLSGSTAAAGTALVAFVATEKVSGIPPTQLYGVALETGTAPKALLALAVVAVVVTWSTPVPVDQGTEVDQVSPEV